MEDLFFNNISKTLGEQGGLCLFDKPYKITWALVVQNEPNMSKLFTWLFAQQKMKRTDVSYSQRPPAPLQLLNFNPNVACSLSRE